MRSGARRAAFAYITTERPEDAVRDSGDGQASAIDAYAAEAGVKIIATFVDAIGAEDPVDERPGFFAMLQQFQLTDVRTAIVETADRLALDPMERIVSYTMLQRRGVALIAARHPGSFLGDDPAAALIHQAVSMVVRIERTMLRARLKGGRERKRREIARELKAAKIIAKLKVEGRKSIAETRPHVVEFARSLAGKLSLGQIAVELFAAGYLTKSGTPYQAAAVKRMLEARPPAPDRTV